MLLSLDIWAFVRLMVQLEDEGAERSPLFLTWIEAWTEVDAQLADLAQSDFEAYSEMMMAAQIDLQLPEILKPAFLTTLRNTIKTLKDKRSEADAQLRKSLKFEIEGLYIVRDQLA